MFPDACNKVAQEKKLLKSVKKMQFLPPLRFYALILFTFPILAKLQLACDQAILTGDFEFSWKSRPDVPLRDASQPRVLLPHDAAFLQRHPDHLRNGLDKKILRDFLLDLKRETHNKVRKPKHGHVQ